MTSQAVSDEGHAGLVALAKRMQLLRKIEFDGGGTTSLDLHAILVASGIASRITSLRLTSIRVVSLCDVLNVLAPGLRTLDLYQTTLDKPLARSLGSLTALTELMLRELHQQDRGGRDAVAAVCQAVTGMTSLSALDIGKVTAVLIVPSLSLMTQLTRLTMDHAFVHPRGADSRFKVQALANAASVIGPALASLANLVQLDLGYNFFNSDTSESVASALCSMTALRRLSLHHTVLPGPGVAGRIGQLTFLRELDLNGTRIPHPGVVQRMDRMEHLDISGNLVIWPTQMPSLRRLDLRNINGTFNGVGISDRLLSISSSLPALTALTSLDLSGNWDIDVVKLLQPYPLQWRALMHLNLSSSRVSWTVDTMYMFHAMPNLTSLDMRSCRINDAIAKNLRFHFGNMTGLRHLDLSGNPYIGPEAISSFARRWPQLHIVHD